MAGGETEASTEEEEAEQTQEIEIGAEEEEEDTKIEGETVEEGTGTRLEVDRDREIGAEETVVAHHVEVEVNPRVGVDLSQEGGREVDEMLRARGLQSPSEIRRGSCS
jgi:hypothetical protein